MAMTTHIAAWVYWPPFSRSPGGYPLMYPGSCAETSKGGVSSSNTRGPRRTRWVRTASRARSPKRVGTAPERTDHACAMASMRHSSFRADPSGVPSS
jgi:hypothetical protein